MQNIIKIFKPTEPSIQGNIKTMSKPTHLFLAPIVAVLAIALLMVGVGMGAGEKSRALCPPRLPEDGIHQVQPDPNLPAEIRAFFGNWHGRWLDAGGDPAHAVPTILVVEEIVSPEKVMVVLGWGECPTCKADAGCQRFWGKIEKVQGKLVLYFGFPQGKTYSFSLDDDRLIGTDGQAQVTMRRLGT
jgi:hypothetical protein